MASSTIIRASLACAGGDVANAAACLGPLSTGERIAVLHSNVGHEPDFIHTYLKAVIALMAPRPATV